MNSKRDIIEIYFNKIDSNQESGHVISSSDNERKPPSNYDTVKPHYSRDVMGNGSVSCLTDVDITNAKETTQNAIESELDNIAETNNDLPDITSSTSCTVGNEISENDVTLLLDEIAELS